MLKNVSYATNNGVWKNTTYMPVQPIGKYQNAMDLNVISVKIVIQETTAHSMTKN